MNSRPGSELAATFSHPGVARAYQQRPPYPDEVFDILARLIIDRPQDVLDLGAGEGAIARPLAARVDHVDAMDVSAAMVQAGRRRPGGQRENLRWIVAAAETAELTGPYALVTAGASLHWMSWPATLTRIARVMTPNAFLAIIEHGPRGVPWADGLTEVIVRHSRQRGYDRNFSLMRALAATGLFRICGQATTAPVPFRQSVDGYVEQFHSTASLARELMPTSESDAFGASINQLVRPYAKDGILEMNVAADIAWGRPAAAG